MTIMDDEGPVNAVHGRTDLEFRQVLQKLPAAAYTTDAAGLISYFNERAVELWGRAPALNDPVDRYCGSFRLFATDGSKIDHDRCWMALALKHNQEYDGREIVVERPDGSRRAVLAHANPIHDSAGQLIGAVNVLVDITERNRVSDELAERNSLTDLRADVATALASARPTPASLRRCCEALVQHLDTAFARIWTLNEKDQVLELQASAGQYTHLDGPHSRVPMGDLKIGRIALNRTAYTTNDLQHDPAISDADWARQEGMVAFSGFPLLVEDRAVGVVAMFARQPFTARVLAEFTPIADAIAQFVDRRRAEEHLRSSERELTDFFENAALGLHWVSEDGTILRANRSELEMLGYDLDEYVGHSIAEFHADPNVIADIMQRLKEGQELRDFEARLRRKDGSLRHVLINSNGLWEKGSFVHSRCFTRDITGRKQAEEASTKRGERLRLLWEAAAVLLTASDPDAMLRELFAHIGPHLGLDGYFNCMMHDADDTLRLESCIGIPERTARSIAGLDSSGTANIAATLLRPIVVKQVQQSSDPAIQAAKASGLRAWVINPLLSDGRLVGTLSFASQTRDEFESDELAFLETICQYVAVAYERLRLLDQLTEADVRKDEFLATLAHELRNPLAPVRNAVQVLRIKGPDEPELIWCRDVIERQVGHLTRLIDDLLDISRITRDTLELRKERVSLAEIVGSAVETSRPAIDQRSHELTVTLPAEPIYLHADLVRLAQVFMNLLSNAAKYTERGGSIRLSAERQDDDLVVRVSDTGTGIPEDMLPRIFDHFFRVDGTLERSQGGLGIGLSLVRRLVELHNGTVTVRSNAGTGTEFTVRLPIEVASVVSAGQPVGTNGQGAPVARRILVVDDMRDAAESLALVLRLKGNDVMIAHDGLDAVEAAERFKPHVVLLDIGMPKLNGFEACARIRKQPWGREMVLIALTGWGQSEDRRRTHEAGFDAHLVKPVDLDVLSKQLDALSVDRNAPDRTR